MRRLTSVLIALAIVLCCAVVAVMAQQKAPVPPVSPAPPTLPVTLDQSLYLIRTTLLTLNDANRSGNYSVLRDLAAPGFQTKNTAADLAQSFADLRLRNFDLFSVALAAPQLSSAPTLDATGMLRLTGLFPTRPLQINFDLLFQDVGGQWRLNGIAVSTPEFKAQPEAAKPPPTDGSGLVSKKK
jgi:hypothetical protein